MNRLGKLVTENTKISAYIRKEGPIEKEEGVLVNTRHAHWPHENRMHGGLFATGQRREGRRRGWLDEGTPSGILVNEFLPA